MRRRAQSDVIPEDLLTFDPQRWIQAATAAGESYVAHIPVEERATHWYCLRIIAPAYYRAALSAAVGRRVGDRHYYALRPTPGFTPLVRADS
jgi:hypothetical protein